MVVDVPAVAVDPVADAEALDTVELIAGGSLAVVDGTTTAVEQVVAVGHSAVPDSALYISDRE